ncbi:MAG: FixH family protein, partial [Pseudomonadota bacterium]
MSRQTKTGELKGGHVLMIAITAFGIIIAANMTMLFAATGSFPGLVVENSYIAGQGWNQRTQAQHDLGWTSEVLFQDGA